jgi:uncharacterized BrkB/YihY/UPF0761 family membrane protein
VGVVYRYAPDVDLPPRSVVPGALLAVSLWALASLAFALGLLLFPDYGAVYGSLGAAISLLLYLYVSAAALLLGAEVNAAVRRGSSEGARIPLEASGVRGSRRGGRPEASRDRPRKVAERGPADEPRAPDQTDNAV